MDMSENHSLRVGCQALYTNLSSQNVTKTAFKRTPLNVRLCMKCRTSNFLKLLNLVSSCEIVQIYMLDYKLYLLDVKLLFVSSILISEHCFNRYYLQIHVFRPSDISHNQPQIASNHTIHEKSHNS